MPNLDPDPGLDPALAARIAALEDLPPCGPRPVQAPAPPPSPAAAVPIPLADLPPCGPRPQAPAAAPAPAVRPRPEAQFEVTLLSVAISLDPERKGYEPPPPPLSAADQARVDRLVGQARRHLMVGRSLAAVQALEEAVAFNPVGESGYQAWLQLGKLQMANPAWSERALLSLRKATALAPERAEPLVALGEVLHRSGQTKEAGACFQRALQIDPSVPLPAVATARPPR